MTWVHDQGPFWMMMVRLQGLSISKERAMFGHFTRVKNPKGFLHRHHRAGARATPGFLTRKARSVLDNDNGSCCASKE